MPIQEPVRKVHIPGEEPDLHTIAPPQEGRLQGRIVQPDPFPLPPPQEGELQGGPDPFALARLRFQTVTLLQQVDPLLGARVREILREQADPHPTAPPPESGLQNRLRTEVLAGYIAFCVAEMSMFEEPLAASITRSLIHSVIVFESIGAILGEDRSPLRIVLAVTNIALTAFYFYNPS